jgi:hypothetical protein
MMYVCLAILFFLLSPGVIVTLPPVGGLFFSGKTSVLAAAVHAVVFVLVLCFLKTYVKPVREAFGNMPSGANCGKWPLPGGVFATYDASLCKSNECAVTGNMKQSFNKATCV